VSVAKMTMISTLGAALIAAVPTTIALWHSPDVAKSTPVTQVQGSDRGSVENVTVDPSGAEVTLSGSANAGVERVGVVLRPADQDKPSYSAVADVTDGKWNLVVQTPPQAPSPLDIKTFYWMPPAQAAGIMKSSFITFKSAPSSTTSTPTPGPVNCDATAADSCFSGPGWGSPSIYRSGQ
jgi:hypothetical protein